MSETSGESPRPAAPAASPESLRRRLGADLAAATALPAFALPAFAQLTPEITRDGAREDARRELAKAIYHRGEPGFLERIVDKVLEVIGDLLTVAADVAVGGGPATIVLIGIVVLLVIATRLGLGPLRARDVLADHRKGARRMSAADYRAEGGALAARGEWKEAVRSRFRAVIRELEERGVLDPRPGRTAGEIVVEASAAAPAVAADLRVAAEVFNTIWYGDRPAGQPAYDRMAQVDDRVRGARLAVRGS